ncbi:hypothetical protein GCK32_021023 [Trichostrongylus colubriformis]|uniref:Uncharacterized protein n=1 Tax=Trichostrongylus colubriformis TaxID=6319 RepID=A0AAN8IEP3_TRICO
MGCGWCAGRFDYSCSLLLSLQEVVFAMKTYKPHSTLANFIVATFVLYVSQSLATDVGCFFRVYVWVLSR